MRFVEGWRTACEDDVPCHMHHTIKASTTKLKQEGTMRRKGWKRNEPQETGRNATRVWDETRKLYGRGKIGGGGRE